MTVQDISAYTGHGGSAPFASHAAQAAQAAHQSQSRPQPRLADVLNSLTDPSLSLDALNARFVSLAGDLVNANSVAAVDANGRLIPEHLPRDGVDELTLKTVFARLHKVTSTSRLAPQDRAALGGDGFAVPLDFDLSRDGTQATLATLVVVLGASTPFAVGLAGERLELLATLYRALIARQRRRSGATGSGAMGDLDVVRALLERKPAAERLKSFATAVADAHDLHEFVVATIAGGRAQRLAFSDIGSPNTSSTVGVGLKKAINSALKGYLKKRKAGPKSDADEASVSTVQRGPWLVAIQATENRPASAFAIRSEHGDADRDALLRQIASSYGRFIALAPGTGSAGSVGSALAARLKDWRVACGVTALLAGAAAIPMPDRVEAPIKLVAEQRRVITAPFDAVLTKVHVKVDETVQARQTVLAELSTHEIDLKIRRSEAKRVTQIAARAIAQRENNPAGVRKAELETAIAAAETELLQYRKSLATITSQIDGVVAVSDVDKRVGSMVARGDTLFEIANPKGVKVEMFVPDSRIPRLTGNEPGEFSLAADPERRWTFKVERIHPSAETVGTRNVFRVEGHLTGGAEVAAKADKGRLRAGMEGVGRIETGTAPLGWLIIRDAVNTVRGYFWI